MSISSEEAAAIKAEHNFLKEQVSQVVEALHTNTKETSEFKESVRELVHELKERDIKDEYKQKEFDELKGLVVAIDAKINDYIKEKQPVLEWAERRKKMYDSLWSGVSSNTGKFISVLLIVGVLMALGIDFTNIKVG